MEAPATLLDAVTYFSDLDRAHEYATAMRWPNGVACPRYDCGSAAVRFIKTRRVWLCKDCDRQFTVKVGTVFEDSPIPFTKWLPAIWLLSSNKNGISSYELAKALRVTQRTAWFILHRIRLAFKDDDTSPLSGEVEADETFIGGRLRHRHRSHLHIPTGRKAVGPKGKTPILGVLQRGKDGKGSKVRGWVIPDTRKKTMLPKIYETVAHGSNLFTDSAYHYTDLHTDYVHAVVNHAHEYVSREGAHVNNLECFWAVLKRTLGGTYIAPRPKHLERYLDEQIFRFNTRDDRDGARFNKALKATDGKRLTYKALTGK
ncbi:MAG TPA: IS1595 family transposase [Candidatus Cybelea sp.]|jgi:transposase-like protein|nr:IS1595 family transposase [Candidatus Cybelea sp.]